MPDDSPILSLPFILPAQAQKHVTHNEALRILDVVVQLVVQDRTRTEPPPSPQAWDRHIVAVSATGPWSGQAGKIALREHGQWSFFTPLAGWRAYVMAEACLATFDGTTWQTNAEQDWEVSRLGVSGSPDEINRLSVNAQATLLNHDGGGHQLKINKAATVDTASLLFQSGFSGRAEMGLSGTDEFTIKVSAGDTWFEALRTQAGSGRVTLPAGALLPDGSLAMPALGFEGDTDTGLFRPASDEIGIAAGGITRATFSNAGLALNGLLSGSAVTQTATDVTSGRVLKVGDYGLGVAIAAFTTDVDTITVNGSFRLTTGAFSTASPVPGLGAGQYLVHCNWNENTAHQSLMTTAGHRFVRVKTGGAWQQWHRDFNASDILGTVSQSGGTPTGRLIERGSNANGDYTRWADGTQICQTAVFTFDVTLSAGSVFRGVGGGVTFPAAFSAKPAIHQYLESESNNTVWTGNYSNHSATGFVPRALAWLATSGVAFRATAIGRWF